MPEVFQKNCKIKVIEYGKEEPESYSLKDLIKALREKLLKR